MCLPTPISSDVLLYCKQMQVNFNLRNLKNNRNDELRFFDFLLAFASLTVEKQLQVLIAVPSDFL
jgi:hypothetical protein